jgi:hypothetical protein
MRSMTFGAAILTMSIMGQSAGHLAVAQGADAKIYRCNAKNAVSLQSNGTLNGDEDLRKEYDGIIIDTLTGAITYPRYGMRVVWDVVQEGGNNNDHVLIPQSDYPRSVKGAAAAGATDFIRVRAWSREPQVRFMAFSLSRFITGTCVVVQ